MMSVSEQLLNAIKSLPADQQLALLEYANRLKASSPPAALHNPVGIASDIQSDLTADDFLKLRREAWRKSG